MGDVTGLEVSAERTQINSDGELAFITVKVIDENGFPVPTADNKISFEVSGPAEIIATDNGDPGNMTSSTSKTRKAFNIKVLAILRPKAGWSGEVKIKVYSHGLGKGAATIKLNNSTAK